MAKRNRNKTPSDETTTPPSEVEVYASNLTLHDLFQQQTTKMLTGPTFPKSRSKAFSSP